MFNRNYLICILLMLFSCTTVKAGPVDWDSAEKYITIQQKQFCDLKNNHVVNLYDAFVSRNEMVDTLIAWNDDIKKQLDKDVIEFLKIMPLLKQKGLPNSRGIILSGPPGTGKTMMAKSLAAQANVTTILISAEMIQGPSQVKKAFKVGRKLAPTLMIIEDIDTAGTVSRRFTDHPILGE